MYRRRPVFRTNIFPGSTFTSRRVRPPPPTCSHFPRRTCQVCGAARRRDGPAGGRAARETRPTRGRPDPWARFGPVSIGRPPGPSANRERRAGRRRPARVRPSDPGVSAFPGIFRVRPVVRRSAAVSPISTVGTRVLFNRRRRRRRCRAKMVRKT